MVEPDIWTQMFAEKFCTIFKVCICTDRERGVKNHWKYVDILYECPLLVGIKWNIFHCSLGSVKSLMRQRRYGPNIDQFCDPSSHLHPQKMNNRSSRQDLWTHGKFQRHSSLLYCGFNKCMIANLFSWIYLKVTSATNLFFVIK